MTTSLEEALNSKLVKLPLNIGLVSRRARGLGKYVFPSNKCHNLDRNLKFLIPLLYHLASLPVLVHLL